MNKLCSIFFFVFISYIGSSQIIEGRNQFISIQPTFGIFNTKTIDITGDVGYYEWDTYTGFEYGLETKMMWSFNSINAGFGASIRNVVNGLEREILLYNGMSVFKPSIFGSIEFNNGIDSDGLSLVLNSGIIRGSMKNNYRIFFSGGPKINTSLNHKKIDISIHPNVLYHLNEKIELSQVSYRLGYPVSYSYSSVLRTFIFNLGIVIELNKLKTKPNKS